MHVGMWGLAVIVIVIASWLLYRYLAPQSWREWTRAGVVQAFIIAFYAEMYGFPLTIYFLARYFGLDLNWGDGGNLWAQLFGTEVAHVVAMVLGYAVVFSGATLVADGWRRIHRARREETLMTDGVTLDLRTRHPWESLAKYLNVVVKEERCFGTTYIAAGEKRAGRTTFASVPLPAEADE